MSFRDDITAEFRLEFQSRDFGNSILRCPNVSVCRIISYILYYIYNMYIIYSIHIYIERDFFFIFCKDISTSLDYFVSSNTCNFKRFENGRGSTSTGGSTTASILRFSFLRIVRYRTTNFVSIGSKSDPSIQTALDNESPKSGERKEGGRVMER